MYERPLRPDELMHFGVLGMRWGIRRYQPYPKKYKGPGQEVGEARRIQDSIRKDINNDEFKTVVNLRQNPYIRLASQKTELINASKDWFDKYSKCNELEEKIVSDALKRKKLKHGSEEAYEEREKIRGYELTVNRKKYPEYHEAMKEYEKSLKNYRKILENMAGELVGNLGDVPVSSKNKYSAEVKDMVEDVLEFKNASYMDKLDKIYNFK